MDSIVRWLLLNFMLIIPAAVGQESWMGYHWNELKERSLLSITLPGSHNAGNTHELGSGPVCRSNYKYEQFKSSVGSDVAISRETFDEKFKPWNINHDHSLLQQLVLGIRYFHLKLCIFTGTDDGRLDISQVFHNHRGYTSKSSLKDFVEIWSEFLHDHPKEVLVLGINNLHADGSATLPEGVVAALVTEVASAFEQGGQKMIGAQDLGDSLDALIRKQTRVALFAPLDDDAKLSTIALRSESFLHEAWDVDSMVGGNLEKARKWLRSEAKSKTPNKFHVLQANPSNAEDAMFRMIQDNAGESSLREWVRPFLRELSYWVPEPDRDDKASIPKPTLNAISTDFLDISRPFEIAMRLMGLSQRPSGEVPIENTNIACLNPQLKSGFEKNVPDRSRYSLTAAHVMQRHTDRWIYGHNLISNHCWLSQKSSQTSNLMAQECEVMPQTEGKLRTVWEEFDHSPDPYASPESGRCQVRPDGTPQATDQGRYHAQVWGDLLKKRYVPDLVGPECPQGAIKLHADSVHKNEVTVETVYRSICGRKPSIDEFTREATLVRRSEKQKGTPWYLLLNQCGSPDLDRFLEEAENNKISTDWWTKDVRQVVSDVAAAVNFDRGVNTSGMAEFLDNINDCVAVHACTGLRDVPRQFVNGKSLLPDALPESLFARSDEAETRSRTWALEYFKKREPQIFEQFASVHYGYFFAVLSDQLRAAVEGHPNAAKLTIAVMSDSNLSPLLQMYGIEAASTRPPYLSALIHEVYWDSKLQIHAVRVIFNGKTLSVCPDHEEFCPLDQWATRVGRFIPTKSTCPDLYANYEFIAQQNMDFRWEWLFWISLALLVGACWLIARVRQSASSTRTPKVSTIVPVPAGTVGSQSGYQVLQLESIGNNEKRHC